MIYELRVFLAQFLCLTLITADFGPKTPREVPTNDARVLASHLFDIPRTAQNGHQDFASLDYSRLAGFASRTVNRARRNKTQQSVDIPGQSTTLLADGRSLLLGGEGK